MSDLPARTISAIATETARVFNVSQRELLGEGRSKYLIRPRFAVAWLARRQLGYSLPRIGRVLNRDHTSVMHAIERCEELRVEDDAYRSITDTLARRVAAILTGGAA